jgi:hypothetical protein
VALIVGAAAKATPQDRAVVREISTNQNIMELLIFSS